MKTAFAIEEALIVAESLMEQLRPYCHRVVIAGSIRRLCPQVHDIELLYIPKIGLGIKPGEMLDSEINLADAEIQRMLASGCLKKRLSVTGIPSWGEKNKLAVHCASGIGVDFFATTIPNWSVSLVVRTGSAETNLRLTTGAQQRGRSLLAYGPGVRMPDGRVVDCEDERDVFELCGVPYLEPNER